MSSDETIFAEVIRLASAAERSAYLDRACAGDAELRRNVEELMLAHERAGGFLEAPPRGIEAIARDDPDGADQPAEQIGTIVGPYRLLEQLGEGGMGVVFMAEQIRPVRRHVALKIIKPGMDTKQVIARFEAERQALAMMDHANIARVFDVGTTASGRPYFAMELVKGIPITDYCDQNQLTPEQRLGLFVQVCRAVQHAHQKGIIHRDLKPSNVLVTLHDGTPVPKVIDFGVAKAVASAGPLTDRTLFTHFAQMVGTPLYMSPEQAEFSGLDIDTRADVYALGVLLYELLTGTTPFDRARLGQAAYDEIRRIIREEEPPKPSTRLSTLLGETLSAVSSRRGTDPKRLGRLVHGELDWIVMKALEKDRTRRYETPSAFAADVQRYLASEPIEASPPSRAYRARKFIRRNKVAITTAALVLVALLAGTIISTWQAVRATRAEKQAQAGAEVANAVAEFLVYDLLAQANPVNEPDRDVKLRTVLDRAAEQIETRFEGKLLVEAAIRDTLGSTYGSLGELSKAERHLKRAVELRQRAQGHDHADTLSSLMNLGTNYEDQGRYPEAEQLKLRAQQGMRRTLGDEHRDTLLCTLNIANGLTNRGRLAESEQAHREVLPIAARVFGESHEMILSAKVNLAGVYWELGRYAESEALFLRTLQDSRKAMGDDHPVTLRGIGGLAVVLQAMGRTAEAELLYEEVLQTKRRVLGPEHPSTLVTMHNLAGVHRGQGRLEDAEKAFLHVLEVRRRVLSDDHLDTLKAISALASVYQDQGRIEEAEGLLIDTLPVHRRVLGPEHPSTLTIMANLLHGYNLIGRDTEAEALGTELLATIRRVVGEDHPDTLSVRNSLACAFANQGKNEEAEPLLRETIEGQTRILGAEHFNTLWTRQLLSMVLIQQHRYAEAESMAAETLEMCRRALGDKHRATAQAEQFLAMAYGNWASDLLTREDVSARDPQRALELSRRSAELMPDAWLAWQVLGLAQLYTGDHRSAVGSVEKSCALPSEHPGGGALQWLVLAMAHKHLGDDDRARAWYTAACQWLQQHPPADAANPGSAARLRAEAAALLGLPEQWPAADWRVGEADMQVYQRMLELNPQAAWAKEAAVSREIPN